MLPKVAMALASTFTVNTATADAFLAAGSAGNPVCNTNCANLNFGGAGTLAISPASSTKGEFDSVVQWDTAGAATQFNTAFGTGNWHITNVSLNLASNFGDQGEQPNNAIFNTINSGQFNVQWLGNNTWLEGTGSGMGTAPGNPPSVTFGNQGTTLAGTTANLGTFTYTPPGDNIYQSYNLALDSHLLSSIAGGSLTSLLFKPADDQIGYLFNAKSFAQNHPQFIITADAGAPVPIPAAIWLFGSGLVAMVGLARRQNGIRSNDDSSVRS